MSNKDVKTEEQRDRGDEQGLPPAQNVTIDNGKPFKVRLFSPHYSGLLPCGCGGRAKARELSAGWHVGCLSCRLTTGNHLTIDEAKYSWNRAMGKKDDSLGASSGKMAPITALRETVQRVADKLQQTPGWRLDALGFVYRSKDLWVHPDGRRLVLVHPSTWELRRKDDTISGYLETVISWLEKDSEENQ